MTPLALWWLLFFGISISARCHRAPWLQALDVQGSKEAVPLEGILDKARVLLPAMVYEAIFMNPAPI